MNHHLMAAADRKEQIQSANGKGQVAKVEKFVGPCFVSLLAEPPAVGLIRIPIAITGQWKGAEKDFSIDLDDLEEIRSNFGKKPTGEINVNYEHASEVPFGTGGPVVSAGRIVKLDEPEEFRSDVPRPRLGDRNDSEAQGTGNPKAKIQNPKFILYGWFEPTERARDLIRAKEYRYVSPAIRWGAKDKVTGITQGTTLTSVALVNKPFLEEITRGPDNCVVASEIAGEQKVFVSLGQCMCRVRRIRFRLHTGSRKSRSKIREARNPGGRNMSGKSLNLKCLTDADVKEHELPASHQGKIGVFTVRSI